jgi:hypothetical protein
MGVVSRSRSNQSEQGAVEGRGSCNGDESGGSVAR